MILIFFSSQVFSLNTPLPAYSCRTFFFFSNFIVSGRNKMSEFYFRLYEWTLKKIDFEKMCLQINKKEIAEKCSWFSFPLVLGKWRNQIKLFKNSSAAKNVVDENLLFARKKFGSKILNYGTYIVKINKSAAKENKESDFREEVFSRSIFVRFLLRLILRVLKVYSYSFFLNWKSLDYIVKKSKWIRCRCRNYSVTFSQNIKKLI